MKLRKIHVRKQQLKQKLEAERKAKNAVIAPKKK
jgi:hypothetical protein